MYYIRHRPAPPLSDFVDFLWCLSEGPNHPTERILPGGTTELVINLRDNGISITDPQLRHPFRRFSGTVVAGPYSRYFDIDASRHSEMLGVHLKPGGARPFLGTSSNELLDTHVDLDQLWNADADRLRTRACEARSPAMRFAVVERALMSRLRSDFVESDGVAGVLHELLPGASTLPVGQIAERAGLSHRHLIKKFSASVGMTPKLFSRVRRFQRAMRQLRSCVPPRWSDFAVECGYADQAHMIREIRLFSGLTPVQHLSSRRIETKDDHIALAT
jgi:AraC-like DNA-binding protein